MLLWITNSEVSTLDHADHPVLAGHDVHGEHPADAVHVHYVHRLLGSPTVTSLPVYQDPHNSQIETLGWDLYTIFTEFSKNNRTD